MSAEPTVMTDAEIDERIGRICELIGMPDTSLAPWQRHIIACTMRGQSIAPQRGRQYGWLTVQRIARAMVDPEIAAQLAGGVR